MCLDMNFYISFGGPVTFKNARVPKEVLAKVPLDRLMIETDCPYLAPEPYRGKRNEPAYVTRVAEAAAQIKGMDLQELVFLAGQNTLNCFRIRENSV
jgi:TatD DNase family protein